MLVTKSARKKQNYFVSFKLTANAISCNRICLVFCSATHSYAIFYGVYSDTGGTKARISCFRLRGYPQLDCAQCSLPFFAVTLGVLVPLVGVLFGYASIFLKVRAVKVQMREHRRRQALAAPAKAGLDPTVGKLPTSSVDQASSFTQEDVRLAKTLFMAFMVFFICW